MASRRRSYGCLTTFLSGVLGVPIAVTLLLLVMFNQPQKPYQTATHTPADILFVSYPKGMMKRIDGIYAAIREMDSTRITPGQWSGIAGAFGGFNVSSGRPGPSEVLLKTLTYEIDWGFPTMLKDGTRRMNGKGATDVFAFTDDTVDAVWSCRESGTKCNGEALDKRRNVRFDFVLDPRGKSEGARFVRDVISVKDYPKLELINDAR
jgi:hypothetical protein